MDDSQKQELKTLAINAGKGDARAFEGLLNASYTLIYKLAFRFCGNQHNAEDITQMVCIKLSGNINGYRGDSAYTTWLYTVVLNTARDWQRAQARYANNVDIEKAEYIAANIQSADKTLEINEDMARVMALPEAEREAVILVFAEGLSHKEAAKVLGCAESTVSWRIHEARKKLAAGQKAGSGGKTHG